MLELPPSGGKPLKADEDATRTTTTSRKQAQAESNKSVDVPGPAEKSFDSTTDSTPKAVNNVKTNEKDIGMVVTVSSNANVTEKSGSKTSAAAEKSAEKGGPAASA